jgi:prolyl-tRNA editing enzyme YbaK/EbsC (Cys-tRNA(Pro) deacylase)
MTCKDRLEEYRRHNGGPFQVQHHARVFTAQEVAAAEHILAKQLAKVVTAIADGKPVMLALPASYGVDRTKAAAVLGVTEVRFG